MSGAADRVSLACPADGASRARTLSGPPLTLAVDPAAPGAVILLLAGHIDMLAGRLAELHGLRALSGTASKLVLDVSELIRLDSTGLGVIIRLFQDGRRRGKVVRVRGAAGQVADLMRMVGLLRIVMPEAYAAGESLAMTEAPGGAQANNRAGPGADGCSDTNAKASRPACRRHSAHTA